MAEEKVSGAPALDTNIESGGFDEKRAHGQEHVPAQAAHPAKPAKAPVDDDDEDEDIDALIDDLQSQDGHEFEEEEEETSPGGGRTVPEDMLKTDSRVGLTESEVEQRRRKFGLNQMKEEKENLVLKFLSYFVGPIQFVMEVSFFFLCLLCFPFWVVFHSNWHKTMFRRHSLSGDHAPRCDTL